MKINTLRFPSPEEQAASSLDGDKGFSQIQNDREEVEELGVLFDHTYVISIANLGDAVELEDFDEYLEDFELPEDDEIHEYHLIEVERLEDESDSSGYIVSSSGLYDGVDYTGSETAEYLEEEIRDIVGSLE